jgi:hypothetical protein
MRRILILTACVGLAGAVQAGQNPIDHRDCDLQPGDFAKPVIVSPLPGFVDDPWRLDDPDVIIDDDGPSEEDAGVIYVNGTLYHFPVFRGAELDK